MAIIEKRGDLQWRARVRKKGYPGQSKTFMLKADAERWAREVEVEMERGTWRDAKLADESFAHYAGKYLKEVTPTKRSSVNESYRIVTLLAAPELRKPVGQIRSVDIAAFRDRRLKEPAKVPGKAATSPKAPGNEEVEVKASLKRRDADSAASVRTVTQQTVLHELNTLSAILAHCMKEWSVPLDVNPVRNVRMPSRSKPLERRVSDLELDWLLRASAPSYGVPQIITLAVETSMRLGELLGLEWKNIDLQQRTAHLVETKNGHSRTVALSSKAIEALQELKPKKKAKAAHLAMVTAQADDAVADAEPTSGSYALRQALKERDKLGRVFHWARSDSFEKTWARCRAKARDLYLRECEERKVEPEAGFLVGVRFHTFRHEATSRLFNMGLNPFEVASMTGHRSMQMLKRYTHIEASKLAQKLA